MSASAACIIIIFTLLVKWFNSKKMRIKFNRLPINQIYYLAPFKLWIPNLLSKGHLVNLRSTRASLY